MNPIAPLQAPASNTYQLNVVFHGLWALRIEGDGIVASTTDDPQHVKKAGAWEAPEFDLTPRIHRLKGVRGASRGAFNDQENLVVRTAIRAVKSKQAPYIIYLPFPREIHSKRKFPTEGRTPMFIGADVPPLPPEIAMVQVLIYDFDDLKKATLRPLRWKPTLNEDNRTSNLHFFAQPDRPLNHPDHFKHAYKELAGAFGLDIEPTRSVTAPVDETTGIAGFPPKEELGLDERVSPGVSGSNCEMLVMERSHGG